MVKRLDKYKHRKAQFIKLCEELAEQFYKKNLDYGDDYFNHKEESFAIDKKLSKIDFYCQIRRKFGRLAHFALKKLENAEQTYIKDESEEDTIKDLAIYCIMELIKRES